MKHKHQWVFIGDILLTYPDARHAAEDIARRGEYCIECGALRVLSSLKHWSEFKSDQTKKFLEPFDSTTDAVIDPTPKEYRMSLPKLPQSKKQKRLGRGLSDLLKQSQSKTSIKHIFPAAKTLKSEN